MPLLGEIATLSLGPPLTFRTSQPGYGVLWLFFFWPSFAVLFAVGGLVLGWLTWRSNARVRANEP